MRMLSLTALLCSLAIVGCRMRRRRQLRQRQLGQRPGGRHADQLNSGGGGGGGAAQTLKLSADPGGALKFDKSSLTAKAGKVTIVLDNPSSLPHAVEIEGNGVEEESDTIGEGETTEVTATVKPGEYEYYCPVDGHKAGGMKGTLTVQ